MIFITVQTTNEEFEIDINLAYVVSFYSLDSTRTILEMNNKEHYYSSLTPKEIRELIKEATK